MNYLDFLLVILLFSTAFWGFRKGLIKSLVGFLAIIVSVWIGFKFYGITQSFLLDYDSIPAPLLAVSSLVLTIVLAYFSLKLIGNLAHAATHSIGLGFINRLGGALFGVLLNVVIIGSFLYYIKLFSSGIGQTDFLNDSRLLPYFLQIAEFIKSNFQIVSQTLMESN